MWTLGVLIGLPVLAVVVIGAGIGSYLTFKHADDGHIFGWFIAGPAAIILVMCAIGFFPYSKPYHYWKPISGTVESVDSRMIKDGDGMSERYVFKIGGDFYGVDDTRASTVKVGDEVSLSCIKEWQWQAAPGWGCRWAGV